MVFHTVCQAKKRPAFLERRTAGRELAPSKTTKNGENEAFFMVSRRFKAKLTQFRAQTTKRRTDLLQP
jgi:hypothetical protein